MREYPVGHVHIVPFARILDHNVVTVHTALADRDRTFGCALGAQFLWQLLYDGAHHLFGHGLLVHREMNLTYGVVRVEYDLGFVPKTTMLFAPVVDLFYVFFFDVWPLI